MAEDNCDDNTNKDAREANQKITAQQGAVNKQAADAVPVPGLTHFTEKRILHDLYQLRDKANLSTYTYVPDLNGRLWHVCDSIGYGIPYSVQFSNPERIASSWETPSAGNIALPQPEPNGLFMPPTAEGTWVICIDPRNKSNRQPMYIEPRVIVSQWPLNAAGDWGKQ
jgi:hypothetical protein